MLRLLSLGEVESILAGDKPGVNKEIVRGVLLQWPIDKFEESVIATIQFAELTHLWSSETIKTIKKGLELAATH